MSHFTILLQISIRNLFANFINVIIGAVVFIGTMLFVIGSSLLNSMDTAMSKSIIGSIGGHVQVYSEKSKDELSLYNFMSFPDLSEIEDFSQIKQQLMTVENVRSVIPMGINGAEIIYGNTLDIVLERLRKAVNKNSQDTSHELNRQIESLKTQVRQIVRVIKNDYKKVSVVASGDRIDRAGIAALKKVSSNEFWNSFDDAPLDHLEFLENRIAYLLPDADYGFLSYAGTDLETFKNNFDRMEIVDGQMVPSGKRGLLLSKYSYENQFKLKTALRLDQIKEAMEIKKSKIEKNPDLQFLIKQNKAQTWEIILQLDPLSTLKLTGSLQKLLISKASDLETLLVEFFNVNDINFLERYSFFYSQIAPMTDLYRVRPGDTMTIKAYTKSGYIESINIKVYGTFQFKGLEKSGLTGSLSLMDLMSFRDLYGYMTPEKLDEVKQLEKASGTKIIDRDKAEEELFGGSGNVLVTTPKETHIDEKKELGVMRKTNSNMDRVYTQAEIEKGVIINAAIFLKDPAKIKETMKQVQRVSDKHQLGLRVVTWQKAAGWIGQFVVVAKAILYLVVFIIFFVALVIINNAVMMAALQRIKEIGTMRAIGASRQFVLTMIIMETILLGLSFGIAGTMAGTLIVGILGSTGIQAMNEFLYFFFSGPKLYPTLAAGSILGSLLIIIIVTGVSALYPAVIATRVSPVTAMQSDE